MSAIIESLQAKQWLWQGNDLTHGVNYSIDTGFELLNQKLHGGWPRHGIVELQCQRPFIGEIRLLLPALAQLAQNYPAQQQLYFWVAPPVKLNATALACAQLPLDQMLIADDVNDSDSFWLAEQALSSGCCAAVVLWCDEISLAQAKRLQFAAKQGRSFGVLIRPISTVEQSLPLATRIKLAPHPQGLMIDIRKRLGGFPVAPFALDLSTHWPEFYGHQ